MGMGGMNMGMNNNLDLMEEESKVPNLDSGFGASRGPDEYVHDPYAGYDQKFPEDGSDSSDGDQGYKNMNQEQPKDASGFEDIFGNPTRPSHNGPSANQGDLFDEPSSANTGASGFSEDPFR